MTFANLAQLYGLSGYELIAVFVVSSCALVLFAVIGINFLEARKSGRVFKEKKSIVETGSMMAFFFVYYFVLREGVGRISIDEKMQIAVGAAGIAVIIVGTAVNILGRVNLKNNWANQIRIYENHVLINYGVYGIVRHPLYASLIWIFFAGALVFANVMAAILNIIVFIPFMYYRAKQEEAELQKKFPEYADYRKKVGMFFPKL